MSLMVGCTNNNEQIIMETEFFEYIIVGENSRVPNKDNSAVVAIVGLTTTGKEQEVIDFPMEIGGKPVRYIGYKNYSTFTNSYYHLESDNLKKMYVHENIKSVYREALYFFSGNDQDLDIMVCEPKSPYLIFADHNVGKYYIYKSLFNSNNFNQNIYGANIVFMNNYSDEVNGGYYRLDNIESGETIPKVPDPARKGYNFTGWYTEPECVNVWDFTVSPSIEEDTEFRLYAAWQAK